MTMLVRGGTAAGSSLPTGATTGQVLQWNGSAWVAATPSASGTTPNATPTVPGLVQLAGDLGGTATAPTVAKINGSTPAPVATSGSYGDLTGRPLLAPVATSGAYTDLTGRPALAPVATSGAYTDLTGRPALATVATSGAYTDLTGRPTLLMAGKTTATSRASTVALTLDPDLVVTVPAAGLYLVEMLLGPVNLSSTQNLSFNLAGTATLAAAGWLRGLVGDTGGGSAVGWHANSAVAASGLTFAVPYSVLTVAGMVTVTAPGTVGVSWAQFTSNATAQTIDAGSWLRLQRIS